MTSIKSQRISNVRKDIIAGIVVCMALIPEAIGFSIVAGVDPMIGVYGTFCIAFVTSIFGGRPGLISGAAGAMALVLASLVKSHGVEYMIAATILTGVVQVILGLFKVGNLIKFIPKPVMTGFVNSLGILMFLSQLDHFKGSYVLIILGIIGVLMTYTLPKINKKIPAPIISIAVITMISIIFKIDIKVLGDMGSITNSLPKLLLPKIPFNLETLKVILPYALSLSIVGIVESLLTAQLIDELTDTPSDKNRECMGQGFGNIAVGLFGGIAGCGMIGQSILNYKYGGRGRISTFTAGTAMLLSIILLNKIVIIVPVVSFAAVMVVVSASTFSWSSVRRITRVPKSDTLVMITTVVVVVLTHNLAYGVIIGTIVSAIAFASKMSEISVEKISHKDNTEYIVKGELFFASAQSFVNEFDYLEDVKNVEIDFSNVKIWDESAVDAIDKVVIKFSKIGIKVNLKGLSDDCLKLIDKIGINNMITRGHKHVDSK